MSDKTQPTASGAEVVFVVFLIIFGMAVGVVVEQNFNWIWTEPTEQQFLSKPNIKDKQELITRLENTIKEAEKQLDTLSLDQIKDTAAANFLEKSHPGIGKSGQQTTTNISAEVQKTYEIAKMQQSIADEHAALLKIRISSVKKEAEDVAKALEPEKRAAAKELTRHKRVYLVARFAAAFLFSSLVVLLAMDIGVHRFNRVAQRPLWISRGSLPIRLVLGALFILLAYRTFEIPGAVFVGIILFLILLRRINWRPAVSE